jgi:hypothetical protein
LRKKKLKEIEREIRDIREKQKGYIMEHAILTNRVNRRNNDLERSRMMTILLLYNLSREDLKDLRNKRNVIKSAYYYHQDKEYFI